MIMGIRCFVGIKCGYDYTLCFVGIKCDYGYTFCFVGIKCDYEYTFCFTTVIVYTLKSVIKTILLFTHSTHVLASFLR